MQFSFVKQQRLLGTADAIYLARDFMGKDPLLVVYPDDVLSLYGSTRKPQPIARLTDLATQSGKSVVLCEKVPGETASQYGVLRLRSDPEKGVAEVLDLVEKPSVYLEKSAYALVGRMVLQPDVVECISEFSLSDDLGIIPMLRQAATKRELLASVLTESRYDVGSHQGYKIILKASIFDD